MLSQKLMQSCTYGKRWKRRLVWLGVTSWWIWNVHTAVVWFDACIVMPGCSESGAHFAISLFMLHDVTNRLKVVSLIFWKSVAMKAGYNRDGELPCMNPTSKSYHWISSIVILFSFADHKMTFLQQEHESCPPVTLRNRNDWLRWGWTKLVKTHDPTTPLWVITLCRITTRWWYEKLPVCVQYVDLTSPRCVLFTIPVFLFYNLLENTHDIAAIKPCMALFRNKNTFGDAFRSSCPPCI
jgi:hypothetical protein